IGRGPDGRILKQDVLRAEPVNRGRDRAGSPPEPLAESSAGAPTAPGDRTATSKGAPVRVPLTRTQQLVARRMASAKATVPEYSVDIRVDMARAIQLRRELATVLDPTPTVNDIVVAAVARTLRKHPRLNASY